MTPETNTAVVPAEQIKSAGKGVASRLVAVNLPAAGNIFAGFEDRSLPPIIKATDLQPGNIVIGRIIGLTAYKQDDIDSALLTLEILDADPENPGQFREVGQKAAMPVGAVLARALGTTAEKTMTSDKQIAQIRANGYENAIIAMRYNGTGKERGNGKAAPHLWDIKLKKADGAVHQHSERVATPTANASKKK